MKISNIISICSIKSGSFEQKKAVS